MKSDKHVTFHQFISGCVSRKPSELLENVAGRIVKEIEKRFPELKAFSIRVSKKRPPVEGVTQWSRVTLYSRR